MTTPLTAEDRKQLEQLYVQALSTVVLLARTLGKPSPIVPREERRHPLAERDTIPTERDSRA